MNKTLIVGLTLIVSAALTTGAMAAPEKHGTTTDVPAALTGLGITASGATKMERSKEGRLDRVFSSKMSLSKVAAEAAKAYRSGKLLPGKYQVVGYASLTRRNSYSLTLERNGYLSIVEVFAKGSGTKVTMRTTSRSPARKTAPIRRTPPSVTR